MYSNLTLKLTSGTDCSGYFGYFPTLETISNNLNDTVAHLHCITISKVVFNDPCTIVIWDDKSKTIVRCHNEPFDKEKGLVMCIAKKVLGEKFHQTLREWCKE